MPVIFLDHKDSYPFVQMRLSGLQNIFCTSHILADSDFQIFRIHQGFQLPTHYCIVLQ